MGCTEAPACARHPPKRFCWTTCFTPCWEAAGRREGEGRGSGQRVAQARSLRPNQGGRRGGTRPALTECLQQFGVFVDGLGIVFVPGQRQQRLRPATGGRGGGRCISRHRSGTAMQQLWVAASAAPPRKAAVRPLDKAAGRDTETHGWMEAAPRTARAAAHSRSKSASELDRIVSKWNSVFIHSQTLA